MSWDKSFFNRLAAHIFAVLFCAQAFAADVRYLTYAGRIVDDSGNPLNGSVQFNIKITNSLGTCVLWEETLTDTLTAGVFGLQIGRGTNVFDGFGSGSIEGIFKQGLALNCKDATPTANITPLVTDDRNMTVSFNDGTGWQSMASQIPIRSVPYALYAANVGNLLGYPIAVTAAPANGQVLQFQSGSNSWVPTTLSGGSSNIVAGGSAAAPGFSFTGDTNTGIFSPGTDQVGISTNGTERVHVDATGNVGIGTSIPGGPLDVAGTNSVRIVTASGASSTLNVNSTSTGYNKTDGSNSQFDWPIYISIPDQTDFYNGIAFGNVGASGPFAAVVARDTIGGNFYAGGMEFRTRASGGNLLTRMAISDAGNVGIGTTTPSRNLEVNGYNSVAYAPSSSSVAMPAASTYGLMINNWTSGTQSQNLVASMLSFNVLNSSSINESAYMGAVQIGGNGGYTPAVVIGRRTGATSYSESMRIDAAGNVGVGTASPGYRLHVDSGTNYQSVYIQSNTDSLVTIGALSGNKSALQFGNGDSNTWMFLNRMDGGFAFGKGSNINSNPQYLSFSNTGNVGIGATSPTASLHLKASSGAVATAPLKLSAGTNLATPEAGAIEFDGTSLYYTDSGNTRKTLSTGSGTFTSVTSISNSGGNITLAPVTTTGSVLINSGTPSVGSASGALVVTGGIGTSGDIYSAASVNAATTMSALTSILTPQLYGSAAASGNIKIDGTSNATKGNVLLASAGGNVGIGTTTPNATLSVTGSSTAAIVAGQRTDSALLSVALGLDSSSGTAFLQNSSGDLLFYNGGTVGLSLGTERMRLSSGGRLGVGTTSPTSALEVAGNIGLSNGASRIIKVNDTDGGANANSLTVQSGSATGIGAGSGGSITIQSGSGRTTGTGGSTALTSGNGGASGAAGNILIIPGTSWNTLTSATLSIAGSPNLGSPGGDGGPINITGGSSSINNGGPVNINGGMALTGNKSGGNIILRGGDPSGTGNRGSIILADIGGGVGIGTATPSSMLDVNGIARTQEIDLQSGGTNRISIIPSNAFGLDFITTTALDTNTGIAATYVPNGTPATNAFVFQFSAKGGTGDTPDLLIVGRNDTQKMIIASGNDGSSPAGGYDLVFRAGNANWLTLPDILTIKSGAPAASLYINAAGNVGIGTTSPQATLDVNGYARLKSYSSAPVACAAGNAGALALTSNYTGCTCNGTSWIKLADATACVW